MSNNTCTAVSTPAQLECQICLDTWRNPIQLLPCGHIFCARCVSGGAGAKCHVCQVPVTGTEKPSAAITAATAAVPVVCSSCGWRGTRREAEAHRCDSRDTNSTYDTYPQRTDEEWLRVATGGGGDANAVLRAAVATADGAGPEGTPVWLYQSHAVYTATKM